MRKYLLFVFICLLPACLVAQNNHQMQQEENQYAQIPNDSLFKELKAIHELQREAKEGRDSTRTNLKNSETGLQDLSVKDISNEFVAMLKIAENTRQDRLKDDWNVYGVVTIIVALVALIVSFLSYYYTKWTYVAQMKTEENTTKTEQNTSKLNLEEQKSLLSDMIRHFYRNYVVSLALGIKLEAEKDGDKFRGYPSEEHLLKMAVNLDDVHLNLFYQENEQHHLVHKLFVMLRNYNIELSVISEHLKSQQIDYATKVRDLQTLTFKCYYLTGEITRLIGMIWYKGEKDYESEARQRIIEEQEKNRHDNADETKYYTGDVVLEIPEESYYLKTLFAADQAKFLADLKQDVVIEAGRNKSDSPKIHIIPFV